MARSPRIDFPEALYHVTVRGNGRTRIFFTEADRTRFLDQFRDNVQAAALVRYAFALITTKSERTWRSPSKCRRLSARWSSPVLLTLRREEMIITAERDEYSSDLTTEREEYRNRREDRRSGPLEISSPQSQRHGASRPVP